MFLKFCMIALFLCMHTCTSFPSVYSDLHDMLSPFVALSAWKRRDGNHVHPAASLYYSGDCQRWILKSNGICEQAKRGRNTANRLATTVKLNPLNKVKQNKYGTSADLQIPGKILDC